MAWKRLTDIITYLMSSFSSIIVDYKNETMFMETF